MARFAFDAVPEVAPTGAPGNDYEHIQANPEEFGGLIAQGEQKLGAGTEAAAAAGLNYFTAKQQLTNEISASETNTWLAKNLTDKFNSLSQLQGKAAQDALPQFKKDTEDLYQQAMKNAGSNLHMQAMIAQSSRYLIDNYYRWGTNHADQQWRTWQDKTAVDRANEYGNQAAIAAQHGTWNDVDTFLNTSDDEVRKNLESKHIDDADSVNAEIKKRRGLNVKNIVDTLSASGDPHTAQAVFDKYKDRMDAGSVLAVTSHLQELNAQLNGRQVADEETGRSPRGGPPAPVAGIPASFVGAIKWREGYDPVPRWDVKQWTVGYGTHASGPDERLTHDQIEQRFNDEITREAKIVDGVNPNLDPGTRAALISLTHNTGDAWTKAGLGERVRAGDIAGAQQKFLEYANVNGQTNEAIARRRWDEAQWFGQAEAPAGHALPDKEEAFNRVIARTANDPRQQTAALARMNQIFSVERADHTQQQVLFNQQVKDSTSEAFSTGKVTTPLTENDFVQNLGFLEGRAQYSTYKQNLVLGADVAAASNMSPQEQQALIERYKPQPGPGFEEQQHRQQMIESTITKIQNDRAKDPAFKQSINDTIDQAARTGNAEGALTLQDFVFHYGTEDGPKAFAQYTASLRLGKDAKTAAELSPQEQQAMIGSYDPQLQGLIHDTGYTEDAAKRQDALVQQIGRLNKERDADPAGYAINHLPDVTAAYQGLQKTEGDPKANDAQKKAARANYAAVMEREQTRIGVDPMSQKLLSSGGVDALNNQLQGLADNDDPAARLSLINRLQHDADMWGDNWPIVMRQLADGNKPIAPIVRAIAAGADPIAMARLLRLDKGETPAKIIGEENGAKLTDMHRELNNAMAPFKGTMVGAQADRDFTPYYGLGEKLSALYMRDGDDAATASIKAFNALVGNRNEFRDTWRIPKSSGVSADDVQAGTLAVRAQLRDAANGPAPLASNFNQAVRDLNLTPQERDLYQRHLANLTGAGGVDNANGSRSTLFQSTVERDGRTYNIPTVWNGKILSPQDAMKRVDAVGWDKFPSYGSQAEAEARYNQMHAYMEKDTGHFLKTRNAGPFDVVPADNVIGLSEQENRIDSFTNFARNGRLVTAPHNDGLNMIDGKSGAPVRTANGRPLLLTWAQLAQLGGTPASRRAAFSANLPEAPAP